MFTEKLTRKYTEFPYILFPSLPPLIVSSSLTSCTNVAHLLQVMTQYPSINTLSSKAHSLHEDSFFVSPNFMGFDNCMMLYVYHYRMAMSHAPHQNGLGAVPTSVSFYFLVLSLGQR